MHDSWTVFFNLTIATLLAGALYLGDGENSVYALYEAAHPAKPGISAEPQPIALPVPASSPAIAEPERPIVLASFTTVSSEADPVEATALAEPPVELATARVNGEAVNLRLGPSTDFDRIGAVVFGDELVLTGKTDGTWVQVQHPVDGSPVWISARFID